jgi:hypothetical protein
MLAPFQLLRPSMSAQPLPLPCHERVVFLYGNALAQGHDAMTKASLAESMARLLDADYAGSIEPSRGCAQGAYVVPCETLALHDARFMGIDDAHDLFGGVTPLPFVATKVITHPLVAADAQAPSGWTPLFADRVDDVVLEGFSAFNAGDARQACARLLQGGSVRVKDAMGVGGCGQAVVTDLHQFDALLASSAFVDPWPGGMVLERNLHEVQTVSVGQVCVAGWQLSYHGRQRLTRNHRGHEVYGGSSLHLVRGDFDVLLRDEMPEALRTAIEQALVYHRAALASFRGLFASRCNYDIVQGRDDAGVWRSGVLEQSWRIGGASGAEIAALHAFRDQPGLRWVDASTHEIYADGAAAPPPGAQVHFDGHDVQLGRLLKYAVVDRHGDD